MDRGLGTMVEHYNRGFAAYRAQAWDDAQDAFNAALAIIPNDGPSAMYIERCRLFAASPPPADWNGIWTLTDK
jgi:adenylate cyclase